MSQGSYMGFNLNESGLKGFRPVLKSVSELEQVRQSIADILLTPKGSRPLFPSFGSSLRNFKFKRPSGDLYKRIENSAKTAIEESEKRIQVLSVECRKDPAEGLMIDVHYVIKTSKIKQKLNFPLSMLD